MHFVIQGNPITKKNHSQIVRGKNGRHMLIPSRQYREYEADALRQIVYGGKPIDYPVNVRCTYYMATKRKCDLTNLLEATDDILVKRGVLADDNYGVIEAHDGSRVMVDKNDPRVEIEIERMVNDGKE